MVPVMVILSVYLVCATASLSRCSLAWSAVPAWVRIWAGAWNYVIRIQAHIRDVRNRFFNFGSVSVRFLKKTRIRFGMNLVRFGLQKLGSVRIVIYYWR